MKKIIDNYGWDSFFCSKCETECDENDGYCQICGRIFNGIEKTNNNYWDDNQSGKTYCELVAKEEVYFFFLTLLKIDTTPPIIKNTDAYKSQRWFSNPDGREYYVFRSSKFHYKEGDQFELELLNFDFFIANNNIKVFYPRNEFSDFEINAIKMMRIAH
jgi:hypothetical protein